MDKISNFFSNYTKAVRVPAAAERRILSIVEALAESDPCGLTKYEVSFKLKGANLLPFAGITNIDANAYSTKSGPLFLSRLRLYREIAARRMKGRLLEEVMGALREVAKTPMDLYFGAEIEGGNPAFLFWLIFGAAGKNGKVKYCPYDCPEIIRALLKKAHYKAPRTIRKKIFHMSIKIGEGGPAYEFYYEQIPFERSFRREIDKINDRFVGYQRHFCSSETYLTDGRCVDQSIFLYIPRGPFTQDRSLKDFLGRLEGLSGAGMGLFALEANLRLTPGQLTLLRFSRSGIFTLYLTASL